MKLLLFFVILLSSVYGFCYCGKSKIHIYFANGMFNSKAEAVKSYKELAKQKIIHSGSDFEIVYSTDYVAYNTDESPLFLIAISESSATALGDLLQGLITLVLLGWVADMGWVLRAGLCSAIVIVNFATIFIAAGTLTFFMNRGSALSFFIIESTLSFTMYPMTKVLSVDSRWILYFIPAALTATLPMNWIENGELSSFAILFFISAACLYASIQFFKLGVKSYRAASYLGAR